MWGDGAFIARRQELPAHRVIAGIALACARLASGFVTACGQSKTPDQHARQAAAELLQQASAMPGH